jgi:hypothetical protein
METIFCKTTSVFLPCRACTALTGGLGLGIGTEGRFPRQSTTRIESRRGRKHWVSDVILTWLSSWSDVEKLDGIAIPNLKWRERPLECTWRRGFGIFSSCGACDHLNWIRIYGVCVDVHTRIYICRRRKKSHVVETLALYRKVFSGWLFTPPVKNIMIIWAWYCQLTRNNTICGNVPVLFYYSSNK